MKLFCCSWKWSSSSFFDFSILVVLGMNWWFVTWWLFRTNKKQYVGDVPASSPPLRKMDSAFTCGKRCCRFLVIFLKRCEGRIHFKKVALDSENSILETRLADLWRIQDDDLDNGPWRKAQIFVFFAFLLQLKLSPNPVLKCALVARNILFAFLVFVLTTRLEIIRISRQKLFFGFSSKNTRRSESRTEGVVVATGRNCVKRTWILDMFSQFSELINNTWHRAHIRVRIHANHTALFQTKAWGNGRRPTLAPFVSWAPRSENMPTCVLERTPLSERL